MTVGDGWQSGTAATPAAVRAREAVLQRLGTALIDEGRVERGAWEALLQRMRREGGTLEALLIEAAVLTEDDLLERLAGIMGLPTLCAGAAVIEPEAVARVPDRVAVHHQVMPVRMAGAAVVLATAHAPDVREEDKLRLVLGCPVDWVLCRAGDIAAFIRQYYGVGIEALAGLEQKNGRSEDAGNISEFVQLVIADAVRSNASDVHIEPGLDSLRLRYRIDGMLYPIPLPRAIPHYQRAIASSIKVLAQLNIADRRLPQDGRFAVTVAGETLDIRVSVLPSYHGEAVNLRILNRRTTFLGLSELGLRAPQLTVLEDLISQPNGVILFVGATGSGKTTSLYAALDRLNQPDRKIVTVEDPVEYQIGGILQMQAHPDIGFTFAAGLRSILRHDPDVILIGEIRDRETADTAVAAALTGHLVFSTLHTNDAASTVTRLMDMGVEPYLIASSLKGIVAQRLVRRVCAVCQEPAPAERCILSDIRIACPDAPEQPILVRGRGCPACRFTGYSGRKAIFEILVLSDALRSMIVERVVSGRLMARAVEEGMLTLRQSGWYCALDGITTVDDVLRVTRQRHESEAAVEI